MLRYLRYHEQPEGDRLNRLLLGDCTKVMEQLPNESIDLVVTDPPYHSISGGHHKGKGQPCGILAKNDGRLFEHNDISFKEWLPSVYRVMKQGTRIYVMINSLNLCELVQEMCSAGFGVHNILVWEKNNCTPSRWYMKNCEYVVFGHKCTAKPINDCGSKTVHLCNNVTGNKLHPTEKPVALMEYYISNSSVRGDTVLDPFMGSGSVGVACNNLGRKFIGIEIDEKYYNIAKERIGD